MGSMALTCEGSSLEEREWKRGTATRDATVPESRLRSPIPDQTIRPFPRHPLNRSSDRPSRSGPCLRGPFSPRGSRTRVASTNPQRTA